MIDLRARLIRTIRRAYAEHVARVSTAMSRFRTVDPASCQRVMDVVVAQRGVMLLDDHSATNRGALASRSVQPSSEIDRDMQTDTVTLRVKPDRRATTVPVFFDRRRRA
jgi:hypothetical protein